METGRIGQRGMVFLFAVLMFLSFFSFPADAQIPRTISYQGYLTNASGVPVDGTVQMSFSIYNVLDGGVALWAEPQPSVPVINGIYNVILGSIIPINLLFDAPYYLGVNIAGEELLPRKVITSVGYAFRAYTVDVMPAHSHSGADISTGMVSEARIDPLIARASALTPLVAHTVNTNNPHSTTAAQVQAAPVVHDHAGVYVGVGQASSVTSAMIADGAVAAADLAGSSVTKPKLSAAGGTAGQVLGTDGTNLAWQAASTGVGWVDDGGSVRLATGTDRVGIGIPNPADELHVLGSGWLQAIFQSTDSSGGIQLVSAEPTPGTPGTRYELQSLRNGGFIVYDRNNMRTVLEALPNGTIQSYGWIQARNGYGDTIAIGGDSVGNDLEVSIYPTDDVKNTISFWNARTGIAANIGVGNITWSAQTRYLSIPAAAFSCYVAIHNSGEEFYFEGASGGTTECVAPVFLPHGASVTRLVAYFIDNDALGDPLQVNLYMSRMIDGAFQQMAYVVSSGSSPLIRSLEDTSIINPIIDNSSYFYFIRASLAEAGSNMKIRGIRIEYSITRP